jgi:hypothetical protein
LYPSADLMKILRLTERLIREGHPFPKLLSCVMQTYGRMGTLFSNYSAHFEAETSCLSSHYYSLLRFCVETFHNVRMHHIVKQRNLALHAVPLRQKLTKTILFSHQ